MKLFTGFLLGILCGASAGAKETKFQTQNSVLFRINQKMTDSKAKQQHTRPAHTTTTTTQQAERPPEILSYLFWTVFCCTLTSIPLYFRRSLWLAVPCLLTRRIFVICCKFVLNLLYVCRSFIVSGLDLAVPWIDLAVLTVRFCSPRHVNLPRGYTNALFVKCALV